MDRNRCTYDGKKHPDGSELCDALRCMVCRDGKWVVNWVSSFGP
jgi:hypothetical protein